MVVPSDTPFTRALNQPLVAIQHLFAQRQDEATVAAPSAAVAGSSASAATEAPPKSRRGVSAFVHAVEQHYRSLFKDAEALRRIPALTPASLPSLLAEASTPEARSVGKLVRFRCMIQDTCLANEVLLSSFPSAAGQAARRNALFGAEHLLDSSATAASEQDHNDVSNLAERTVMHGVSVPGETAWAASRWESSSSSPQDDVEGAVAAMRDLKVTGEEGRGGSTSPFGQLVEKMPLPERPCVGALIKLYDVDQAEKLHLTQIVDVVGVLDRSELPGDEWDGGATTSGSAQAGADAQSTNTQVPCVHALYIQPTDEPGAAGAGEEEEATAAWSAEERSELVEYLAQALQGDTEAAEWVLLALLARIHSRQGATAVGSLSVNLTGFPAPPAPESVPALAVALSQLSPRVVVERLSVPRLNDARVRMAPRGEGDALGVRAGRLQLPRSTTLLVDEGGMGEGGRLADGGVRNVQALAGVLGGAHRLAYRFPFNQFEMDVDVNAVVLSQAKSFLPADVQVELEPAGASQGSLPLYLDDGRVDEPSTKAASSASRQGGRFAAEPERLARWRAWLARARAQRQLAIPDDVSEAVQSDFVAARRRNDAGFGGGGGGGGQEDLARRMGVARLLAFSRGRTSLDVETWRAAVEMDERRRRRVEVAKAARVGAK